MADSSTILTAGGAILDAGVRVRPEHDPVVRLTVQEGNHWTAIDAEPAEAVAYAEHVIAAAGDAVHASRASRRG